MLVFCWQIISGVTNLSRKNRLRYKYGIGRKNMRKRRRGYRKYKFTEKTLSKRGITALVLALLSLVSFVVMVVLAFRSAGNLSIYIACYGILAFFCSISRSDSCNHKPEGGNSFRSIPYAATFLSIFSLLIWIAVYAGGILL